MLPVTRDLLKEGVSEYRGNLLENVSLGTGQNSATLEVLLLKGLQYH